MKSFAAKKETPKKERNLYLPDLTKDLDAKHEELPRCKREGTATYGK
jgi:hypothetical protein